jgi:hypothetical protein
LEAGVCGIGDPRKPLTILQIREFSRGRTRDEPLAVQIAREETIRLAKRIVELDMALKSNHARMVELIRATSAAPLLEETGIGAVIAAVVITTWSHPGRVRNESGLRLTRRRQYDPGLLGEHSGTA